MRLFTDQEYHQLLKNGSPQHRAKDHVPVVKLYLPETEYKFLLTETYWEDPSQCFGLCDFGSGFPELRYIDLDLIKNLKGSSGEMVIPDPDFTARFPISIYEVAAAYHEKIIENEFILESYFQEIQRRSI